MKSNIIRWEVEIKKVSIISEDKYIEIFVSPLVFKIKM